MLDIGDRAGSHCSMHFSSIPIPGAALSLCLCRIPVPQLLKGLRKSEDCSLCLILSAADAGPFRKKPPWTDINRIDADALLEFGEKVPCLMRAALICQHRQRPLSARPIEALYEHQC